MQRLLHDPPLDGPTNMARDEALLTCVGRLEAPPTLRLYQWDPPTVSLGYFQRYADFESLTAPAGELDVVRRLTGGGAILHDQELTYSLILPVDHRLLSDGSKRLYELAHDAIVACLENVGLTASRCGTTDDSSSVRGPFFCFERRHRFDLLIENDKIAGSAQRRTREAVLQHGSIVLGNRFDQQPTAVTARPFEQSLRTVRAGLPGHFKKVTGEVFEPGIMSEAEVSVAADLVGKYAGDEWTRRL